MYAREPPSRQCSVASYFNYVVDYFFFVYVLLIGCCKPIASTQSLLYTFFYVPLRYSHAAEKEAMNAAMKRQGVSMIHFYLLFERYIYFSLWNKLHEISPIK